MKTFMVAAVVLAGTIGIGIGTAAQAEEKRAPEPGTWQYQYAVEAGSLPATGENALPGGASRKAEKVPTIEVGGLTYRVGIDTGP